MWWSCDCHVTGALCFPAASVVLTLANVEGEETFDSSLLGQANEVIQERVCDDELNLVKGYVGRDWWVGQEGLVGGAGGTGGWGRKGW